MYVRLSSSLSQLLSSSSNSVERQTKQQFELEQVEERVESQVVE